MTMVGNVKLPAIIAMVCIFVATYASAICFNSPQDRTIQSLLSLIATAVIAVYFGIVSGCVVAVISVLFETHVMGVSKFFDSVSSQSLVTELSTLVLFVVIAVVSGIVSGRIRERIHQAQMRESEVTLLFEASETISRELDVAGAVSALSQLLRTLCDSPDCLVWQMDAAAKSLKLFDSDSYINVTVDEKTQKMALVSGNQNAIIGFDKKDDAIWRRAALGDENSEPHKRFGVFVPLTSSKNVIGVLYVENRSDGRDFDDQARRLILTLANHLSFVFARDALMNDAAQAVALRESDALKDSIVSMVSHELRSPLAAIKATASAEILEYGPSIALCAINDEADRLTVIIDNLLNLSRLGAGAWNPDKDWCDLSEVIGTCLDRLPDEHSIRVRVDIEKDLPLLYIDYLQIALAISNLLENAIKYSGADTPIIVSAVTEHNGVEDRPTNVSVTVRDFGDGISPNDFHNLFQRFFRSPEHRKNGISGTGLGLALVKAIAEGHGGKVWANNAPADEHTGAMFTILMPIE